MTTQTLEAITKAEAAAQEAAVKAIAAAQIAQARAEDARLRAEQVRAAAYREFLDLIAAEWPAARALATTAVGEAHAALVSAVRNGGNVFQEYQRWVSARIELWATDSELSQIRNHHGLPVRSTDAPIFNFGLDVGAILDQVSGEMQDAAVQRITARRTAFVNGAAS